MADTAQPVAAETDPNVQLQSAADAFKAFTTDQPIERPRDERGRFATADGEEEIEAEGEGPEAESDVETVDDDEQPYEAQPEAVELPASWSKEDAELWQTLPPEAQARIAEREGERDRAVNQKFQEAANVRKAVEAHLTEANANRDKYAAAIDEVMSFVTPQRPDPYAYGLGTENYNRDGYDLALAQYEQTVGILTQLRGQRQAIAAQQEAEAERAARTARDTIEEAWKPKLLEVLPDLADPSKGGTALHGLIEYAVSSGIEQAIFEDPKAAMAITSAELLILEKARRYDAIQAAKGRVRDNPAPKPATPTARPGVATSRSAQRATQYQRASQRLAKSGSIEDGAAIFRHFLK